MRLLCTWCGHADDHPHPCDKTIITEAKGRPVPCPCRRRERKG